MNIIIYFLKIYKPVNSYLKIIFDILKNPKTWVFLFFCYFKYFIWIKTKPIILNKVEFNPNKSFIRWWDWESLMLLWLTFFYEEWNIELSTKFNKILNYKWNKFILWLPFLFIENEEKATIFLRAWLITRNYFNKIKLSLNNKYWDAFYFINLWNIWNFINIYNAKKLFLVSNIKTINKVKNISELNFVWFQEIPEKNSYKLFHDIKKDILNKLKNIDEKNLVIIISWWPIAKVLAYDLTINFNYVCHDVWSYFDRNL